jgi:hypothetical protein
MQYTILQINTIQRNIALLNDHYRTENINNDDNIKIRILLLKGILKLEEKHLDNLISENSQKEEEARKQKLIAQLHEILDYLKNNNFEDGYVLFSRIEYGKAGLYPYFIKISFHNNKLLFEHTNIDFRSSEFGEQSQEYITDESLNSYSRGEHYLRYIYDATVGGKSRILESIPEGIQSRLLQISQPSGAQSGAQDGGKPKIYKITDTKVQIVHNKKTLTRNVYIKKNIKYCKINNKYILLSKLKHVKHI